MSGDPAEISRSVAVGPYRLDVGPPAGTSMSLVPEQPDAADQRSHLSGAIKQDQKAAKRRGAVDDVQLVTEDADEVTGQTERAVKLWTEIASGSLEVSAVNAEIDSLLALLQKLDRSGRFDEQFRLARALSRLLAVALRWLELLRSLRELLAAAERHGDERAKAWALHELGTLHLAAGNVEQANRALSEARELRSKLGDSRGLAATDRNLQVLCRCLRQMLRQGELVQRTGFRKLLHAPVAVLVAVLAVAIGGSTAAVASGLFGGGGHSPLPTTTLPANTLATTTLVVPNVTNRPIQVATATLRRAGFVPMTRSRQSSDTVPSGYVISTAPAAGAKAAKGSKVTMVVSTGASTPGAVVVPDVIGLSERAAATTLKNAGLTPSVGSRQSSDHVPSGYVISTVPAANTQAAKGSTVTMVISTGPPTPGAVKVPNVIGRSEGDASATLKNAGLTPSVGSQQSSDTVPSGYVISTAPAPGAEAANGSRVTMVISTGPPTPGTVVVPNVVGLSEGDASTTLKNAGFAPATASTQCSNTVPSGYVISTVPAANTQAASGSTVAMVVSSGACLT